MKIFSSSIILLLAITLLCCRPPEEPLATQFDFTGELVGLDVALCACCGGHIYEQSDSSDEYRIIEFPSDFQSILDTLELPRLVNVNYRVQDTCGVYNFLIIDDIEVL